MSAATSGPGPGSWSRYPVPHGLVADRVKAIATVIDVASWFGFEYVDNPRFRQPCPVCMETSSSGGAVSITDGARAWHCFRCSQGGDCIAWIAARSNIPRSMAISELCRMLGLDPVGDALSWVADSLRAGPITRLAGVGEEASALRAVRARYWAWRGRAPLTPIDASSVPVAAAAWSRIETGMLRRDLHASLSDAPLAGFVEQATALMREDFPSVAHLPPDQDGDAVRARVASWASRLRGYAALHGSPVRDYLVGRGFARGSGALRSAGYWPGGASQPVLDYADRVAGLALARDDGSLASRFASRLTLPIGDACGVPVSFAGRVIDDSTDRPKWINGADSPAFVRRAALYGISSAAEHINRRGYSVVVEGYFDVHSTRDIGVDNSVACFGTEVTRDQAEALSRLAPVVVLLMDGDSAGSEASARIRDRIRSNRLTPVVASLGEGDPDEVARGDPDRLLDLIRRAAALGIATHSQARPGPDQIDRLAGMLAEEPDQADDLS